MAMSFEQYCKNNYSKKYKSEYFRIIGNKTSANAQMRAEREAQKNAIESTFKLALKKYPDVNPADLWDVIYSAHLLRKTGKKLQADVIESVISAAQSWKKSSGHAFESFIAETANPALKSKNLQFLLQKDLQKLMKEGKIANGSQQLEWLESQVKKDVFDLYALYEFQKEKYVYGVIQSKTSIRDRVSRDREPSIIAMKKPFWSVAVTLNGDFFRGDKFNDMVNGGTNEYQQNGWHGMYVLSNTKNDDRIYLVDSKLSLLVDHATQASRVFTSSQKTFTAKWKAQ